MEKLVLIGNGMAGIGCVEQILRHGQKFAITVFGDEPHVNYNRILLSSVLAGEKCADDIVMNGLDWYQRHGIALRLGVRIISIDKENRTVTGDDGSVTPFDKLIIATGSMPLIPPMEGTQRDGVFVFRTLDDTRALLERSRPGIKAAVIGGGLLGLEAARGLQVQGCDVSVVHLMPNLMERQLDSTGSALLKSQIERMGVNVLLGRSTTSILGNGRVEGLAFKDGSSIDAELVVIAAGIRPNAQLAREAGLKVNRGIVVDDWMETSHPGIYAVGECAEHRGLCYGLVAPLLEQGKALAAVITGNPGPGFESAVPASKLKIMGVEVFSAGTWDETAIGGEAIRFEDPSLGLYRKLVLKDNRLAGFILVGDTSDSPRYLDMLHSQRDLSDARRHLLFPPPAKDEGLAVAEMADSHTVCGCMGVSKSDILQAIRENGVCTLAQLKDATRASTGCGSCTDTCRALLKAAAPEFEEESARVLCACVPFPQEQLREMVRSQQLRSVQDVLDIYGNGTGCEICKPALSYIVDVVWCGDHEEDRSARFINDRVHANIQKDGTFSVVPRMRGGVTSPDELRRIADVAEKYNVRMVKVTGSQRLDLLGVKKSDLPKIWADLGMPSGQAYTKGVRMVKTCVGTDFCRFGVQDSTSAGIELERRLENLYTPHKVKMGAVGCPRNCAEATVKDIGLIGQEGSWQIVVGGGAVKKVRKADVLTTVETTDEALEAACLFFQYYREQANYLERTYDFVERVGIEKIRRDTIYALEETRRALLDRLARAKALSSDPWLERDQPRTRTQFVQIQPMEMVAQ
ncbi:MAG TPA: nitrite reductase large subunit NirB [Acidobacteriaceae bacterium]|nr:nitrite reductase large subunit NirB [Acidobacteriaceae bacterium]